MGVFRKVFAFVVVAGACILSDALPRVNAQEGDDTTVNPTPKPRTIIPLVAGAIGGLLGAIGIGTAGALALRWRRRKNNAQLNALNKQLLDDASYTDSDDATKDGGESAVSLEDHLLDELSFSADGPQNPVQAEKTGTDADKGSTDLAAPIPLEEPETRGATTTKKSSRRHSKPSSSKRQKSHRGSSSPSSKKSKRDNKH
eukprot:GHVT01024819.1.p1 GENE.GHVT01024819.1~~GHVT01024819.1.p1  ORF type:complete len:200 (+),score=36.72 GHVT01024819.1:115-714(+)